VKKGKDISADPSALRSRAEEQLKKLKAGTALPRTEEETQRLLHELQVHQIELEMQNEELRQTREETEAALERYTDLYDFAPAGYMTLSKDGIISEVNLTGSKLLGTERSRLVNKSLNLFITDEDRPVFNAFLRNVFERRSKESCEIRLRGKDRPSFVYIEAKTVIEGLKCHVIVVDITRRRELEMDKEKLILDLREALARVKQLSGLLPICMFCKKIRNTKDYWEKLESYISKHSEATFSHGLCPECFKNNYPEYYDEPGSEEEK